MRIALVGYMGAGKSYWGKKIAEVLNIKFLDLDSFLEEEYLGKPVFDFVQAKGELPFRKFEREALLKLSEGKEDLILATGGGTPCYYNNMDVLNTSFQTIYLDIPIMNLFDRLVKERDHRPLISHLNDDELMEFIAKHLFERRYFYNMAKTNLYYSNISLESLLKISELQKS